VTLEGGHVEAGSSQASSSISFGLRVANPCADHGDVIRSILRRIAVANDAGRPGTGGPARDSVIGNGSHGQFWTVEVEGALK
jgi:hypothetical protein